MIDPSAALREGLASLGRSGMGRRVLGRAPASRRFAAGECESDCVETVSELLDKGRLATVDFLARPLADVAQASRTRDSYLSVIGALHERGLTSEGKAEVTVRLSALGGELPDDGARIALDSARQICEAAAGAGTTVTVQTEGHATVEATLQTVRDLRSDFPSVGVALQASLRRTEDDCRELSTPGSRVRLVHGAGEAPESVGYQDNHAVDLSYVRCLKVLMEGHGYPMVATCDPSLIEIARSLSDKQLRAPDSFEFQLPLGVRVDQQARFAEAGHRMRVYVPYGDEWAGYVTRLLVEHPGAIRRHKTKG